MEEKEIGKVTHFFGKLGVIVMELSGSIKAGDKVHVRGAVTDFEQEIGSMQIDRADVTEGKAGESVGIKVKEPCRKGDIVYKVEE